MQRQFEFAQVKHKPANSISSGYLPHRLAPSGRFGVPTGTH